MTPETSSTPARGTTCDTVTISGGGFSVQATAQVSQVGPNGEIQAVSVANSGSGYSSVPTAAVTGGSGSGAKLTAALTLSGVMCSDGASACYPPVVNYDPRYYLVNGKAFDKTNPNNSLLSPIGTSASPITLANGALLRLVNAGLRMHVPSVVGLSMSLVAEDGNVLPGIPRTQSEVFLAAGKTYDVMLKPVAAAAAYGLFDRALSLSTDNVRDGGMQAYVSVNGGSPARNNGNRWRQPRQVFPDSG